MLTSICGVVVGVYWVWGFVSMDNAERHNTIYNLKLDYLGADAVHDQQVMKPMVRAEPLLF